MTQNRAMSLYTVTKLELVYHNKAKPKDRLKLLSSTHAYETLMMEWDMNKIELLEQFKIILLDNRNYCLGLSDISTGGMTSCLVDPRLVFATALQSKATQIILAHNHPSGDMTPSKEDIAITRKLRDGGKLLDISVLDHLIVTPEHYYSFCDNGMMPI